MAAALLYSCSGSNPIKTHLFDVPPYKRYVRSLEKADLDKTAMAQAWLAAGERALKDSVEVNLPFSESGYFKATEPDARSYQFIAKEGQVLTVNGAVVSSPNATFFLDLFSWEEDGWKELVHADSSLTMSYEFEKDMTCLIRIQPELLLDAYYTLSISATPVLINPVAGADNKSIGSFYGASRDGGKRSHEGVDIFAKKGTPVIAPTSGYISRVSTNNLGGKVVWMQDKKRQHSYYFAHLDSQLVKPGVIVKQGDTLGTVGNTGNARYTPSHLHFGIYRSKSKDPINYIRTLEAVTEALPWDTTFRQSDFKVVSKEVNFRAGPGEKHLVKTSLKKDTYVKVIAQSNAWYRVALPDKSQGFLTKKSIAPIENGKRIKLKSPAVVRTGINDESIPVAHLNKPTTIYLLAQFEGYQFIKTKEGLTGWLVL